MSAVSESAHAMSILILRVHVGQLFVVGTRSTFADNLI